MRNTNFKFKMMVFLFLIGCLPFWVSAQNITVRGKVTDPNNDPIIGASVLAKGTSSGTVTDLHGNFTLQAPAECP